MKPKDASVNVVDLHPELLAALPIIERTRRDALQWCLDQELVITSGAEGHPGDGTHSRISWHYPQNCPGGLGLAIDAGILDFARRWAWLLELALGDGWDILIEPGPTIKVTCKNCRLEQIVPIPTPHAHLERDPKKWPLPDPTGSNTTSGGPRDSPLPAV